MLGGTSLKKMAGKNYLQFGIANVEACGGRELDGATISWLCMDVSILPIYANISVTFMYLVGGWAGRLNFGTPGARNLR